jgi:hypothetical protein
MGDDPVVANRRGYLRGVKLANLAQQCPTALPVRT